MSENRENEPGQEPASHADEVPIYYQPDLEDPGSAEQGPQGPITPEIVGAYIEERYSGPIPHPRILRQINEIVPGAAKQILDDAHGQTAHRQEMERTYLKAGIQNGKRGQWFGFIVAMTVVLGSMGLIALGQSVWGFSLALFGLAALVGVFVYTQKREAQELREASQAFPSQAFPGQGFPQEIVGAPDEQSKSEDGS